MTGCSFNVAIMHVVFYLDCRSLVFTGPRNLTNLTARPPYLYELEANETHPARINCHVDCFDNEIYDPTLLLINAKNANRLEIPPEDKNETNYRAVLKQFNNCNTSNNYSDYEYKVYLLGDQLDDVVIACGLDRFRRESCWGQTHAIVHYIYNTDGPGTTTDDQFKTTPFTMSTVSAEAGLSANVPVKTVVPIIVILALSLIALAPTAAIIIAILSSKLRARRIAHTP